MKSAFKRIKLLTVITLLVFIISLIIIIKIKEQFSTLSYVITGIVGTVMWVLSLLYVLRKYRVITFWPLKWWLNMHLWFGGIGFYLIVIHSDFHFRAVVPSIDFFVMFAIIFTGLVGYFIYITSLRELNTRQVTSGKEQWQLEELAGDMALQELMVSSMGTWRLFHRLLTIIALMLTIVHGVSVYFFRGEY